MNLKEKITVMKFVFIESFSLGVALAVVKTFK